jgi:PAS domain S-box-containing protein
LRSQDQKKPFQVRYGAGLVCLMLALLVRAALNPLMGTRNPYATIFIAVLVAARYWGAGPALMVAVGGAAASSWMFRVPGVSLTAIPDSIGLGAFALSCAFAVCLIELLRRAHDRAAESARLADERLVELQARSAEHEQQQKVAALLKAIVDSTADGIVSTNLDGIIQSWNLGAQQIFGYTPEDAIGQPIDMLLPPDRRNEEADMVQRIRQGARITQLETVRVRRDGKQIPVSLTASPVRDESGAVFGVSQIARDTTEQKQLEQQLRESQKLESLGVLAGGVAHDFNNLLTGIMGNASLAAIEPDNAVALRERIQEVLNASERAAQLVRQMLAYAGKGQFVLEPIDLSLQIREIEALLRTSIPRLVELELDLDAALPPVAADRAQLQQVVMNLAMNGAEAIGDRAGIVAIRTRSREVNGERQAVLEVADTGCGMDEHTKARIFDPFFSTKFTGRGLGLAAVMGITRTHGASISVESAPGKGSRFTVVFPASAASSASVPHEPHVDLRGFGNILVVDDEDLIRSMARFTLERCGYNVVVANDGKAAVDLFTERPDDFVAVLLDLTMPVMNGEEALRQIRRVRPDVPVILSSGFSETEAVQRFQKDRLSGFLQKPYTGTALARRIKQAVAG